MTPRETSATNVERIRLRPFTKEVQQPSRSAAQIAGGIVGHEFVVRTFGQTIALDTLEIGSDNAGPFALVPAQEHELAGRIRLLVTREYEEEAEPGGQISVDLPFDSEVVRRAVEAAGLRVPPDRMNLLVPIQRGFSVFFDSEGRVNGSGWIGPAMANS